MIRIRNKLNSMPIYVEGMEIPPLGFIDIEIPRTPQIRSLESRGSISVSELKNPNTEEIYEHNDIDQNIINETNDKTIKSSSKRGKKN